MRSAIALFFLLSYSFTALAESTSVRVATYNIASGLRNTGELEQKLTLQNSARFMKIATVIQHTRPDILLLTEFDYQADSNLAELFQQNYLSQSQFKQEAISYPYTFSAPVNTGTASGLDLSGDGKTDGPADAWGFGFFPGQYGMQVLSRYPIDTAAIRSFQKLLWASMPDAQQPINPETKKPWYPADIWSQLRLSSKSHWDIPIQINGSTLHLLASHPTPPVFDGPEDRNGRRNHDEIRLFADYIEPQRSNWIVDDLGACGGLNKHSLFVIAGDLNADPHDGDSSKSAIAQLLNHDKINSQCVPASKGAAVDSQKQAGANLQHKGDPATDTGKFNPKNVGNLRLDYILPSANIEETACGVFWPEPNATGADWIDASDHHLVWVDINIEKPET